MIIYFFIFFFFFSSRRRHTRLQGDWSSDVCSSDLHGALSQVGRIERCLEVVRPCEVAVERQPRRQNQACGEMRAIAGPPAAVFGVARVAGEGEAGKWAPSAAAFELPRPGSVQPAERETEVCARPVDRKSTRLNS